MTGLDALSGLICPGLLVAGVAWVGWRWWSGGVRLARQIQSHEWCEAGRCGACGYDLRAGHDCCPECGSPAIQPWYADVDLPPVGPPLNLDALADNLPVSPIVPREPTRHDRPVVVHVTRDGHEADLLARQLQARGVWCYIEEARTVSRLKGPGSHGPDLLVVVADDDERTAKAIVSRFQRPGNG